MSALRWKLAQFFEQLWWKQYLIGKSKHQYLQWKQGYWQQFIMPIKKNVPTLSSEEKLQILDAGCGPAGIFIVLQQHQITAVDPLLSQYEQLPHFSKNDYVEVNFIETTLEKFQAEKKFDVVFCLNAINHVEDIKACINNLYASLKPKGYLVLSVDVHRHNFLKKIFQLIPGDILHLHQYSLEDYLNLLAKENMKIVSIETIKQATIFNYVVVVVNKKLS